MMSKNLSYVIRPTEYGLIFGAASLFAAGLLHGENQLGFVLSLIAGITLSSYAIAKEKDAEEGDMA